MADSKNEITLKLTLSEVNLVLEALGNLPFRQVFEVVGKIQEQAGGQIKPPEAVNESKAEEAAD